MMQENKDLGASSADAADRVTDAPHEASKLSSPSGSVPTGAEEELGRFGHHPDPAIDYLTEVERIEGLAYDVSVGAAPRTELFDAVARALTFRVGAVEDCVVARHETLIPLAEALEDHRNSFGLKAVVDDILRRREAQAEACAERCDARAKAAGTPNPHTEDQP